MFVRQSVTLFLLCWRKKLSEREENEKERRGKEGKKSTVLDLTDGGVDELRFN